MNSTRAPASSEMPTGYQNQSMVNIYIDLNDETVRKFYRNYIKNTFGFFEYLCVFFNLENCKNFLLKSKSSYFLELNEY